MYQDHIDALIAGWNQANLDALEMISLLGLIPDPSAGS